MGYAHILEEYGLPYDIWRKIENINLKINFKLVLKELNYKYNQYWREKFRNYENRFFTGFLKDNFKHCSKYFTHDMHIVKRDKISPYHIIYQDHFYIVKFQKKKYKDFYFNNKRKLFH